MEYILQFGEGNFLRAFAEDYLQTAVENGYDGRVIICQPRINTKVINALKAQNNEYRVIKSGLVNGRAVSQERRITCVESCIDSVGENAKLRALFLNDALKAVISNTTEAGISFCKDDKLSDLVNAQFPAKLCALLYERFAAGKGGLVFIPVELIEDNGDMLKKCICDYAVLWNKGDGFIRYINEECSFCNTLVDCIVTGHPQNDSDPCSVSCEPYKSFIIEASPKAQKVIPFKDVTYTDDLKPYRTRKVRILNGAHTMSVLAGYMAGFDIVRDMVSDNLFAAYINRGLDEIKKTIGINCDDFALSVIERFKNPYIDHKLLDISLNSVSKFRVRCLDTIIDYYEEYGVLPQTLVFSLAALIAFYLKTGEREYELRDNADVLEFFAASPCVFDILGKTEFWGRDLNCVGTMGADVQRYFDSIKKDGIITTVKELLGE